jgi:4-amino-4-deoxy-L-arabinose transferase-like glycosyltransferase
MKPLAPPAADAETANTSEAAALPGAGEAPARRGLFLALLLACAVFAAIAPTLSWLEFSGSMENLNVATALEIRRSGRWLIPMLEGEPRIAKPPLAAWITAAAIPDALVRGLSSRDPQIRAMNYRRLAFAVRASALLCACLTLLAAYELGRTLDGVRAGLIAAAVLASNYAFLRFGRQSNTDVQLLLWVTLTNVLLAKALLEGRRWLGFIGAGAALGLAIMSKGPVALIETIVPFGAYALWRGRSSDSAQRRPLLMPMTLGCLAAVAVALPWFIYVQARYDVWSRWRIEVTRIGATGNSSSNPLMYLIIVPMLLPWIVPFVLGLIEAAIEAWTQRGRRHRARRDNGWVLALMLIVVPLVLMSFFHDRKDRYVLPMIPAAAVVTGAALARHAWVWRREDRWIVIAHWIVLGIVAVGLPLAGFAFLRTADGAPWYTASAATGAACAALILLLIAIRAGRGALPPMIVTTVLLMLGAAALFTAGYRNTRQGRSEMRPLAEAVVSAYPDAEVYNARDDGRRISTDLAIYLNRSTLRVSDWRALKPGARTKVVILQQPAVGPAPAPSPPPGWIYLAKVPRDREWYYAFALPAAGR